MDRSKKIETLEAIAAGRMGIEELDISLPLAGETGIYDREPGYFTCMNGRKIKLSTIDRLKEQNPGKIIKVVF